LEEKDSIFNNKKVIISLVIVAIILLLFMFFTLISMLQKQEKTATVDVIDGLPPTTKEDVFRENNIKVLENDDDNNEYNVKFEKRLYDDEGRSNKEYFDTVAKEISSLHEGTVTLIDYDDETKTEIKMVINPYKDEYTINGENNYFEKVDGDFYNLISNMKPVESSKFISGNTFVSVMQVDGMRLSSIEKYLGEKEEDLKDGYMSYLNGTVKLNTIGDERVRNIIFSKDYEGNITNDFSRPYTLNDIAAKYDKIAFGGLEDNYLGYINDNCYYFFYPDETSIYGRAYSKNSKFENILDEYIKTKDIDKFVKSLNAVFYMYDSFEFNEQTKRFDAMYSLSGIEIKIRNNDPKGIILHNNYFFTKKTRDYVSRGIISFSNTDLVHEVEKNRREGK